MKKVLSIVVAMALFVSCSTKNEAESVMAPSIAEGPFELDQYPQKWQLTRMTGSLANVPPTEGKDMEWQEYYLLSADGTFVKSRDIDDKTIVQNGTYSFVDLSGEKYFQLIYVSGNELVASCTSDKKELLRLVSDTLLVGTWLACDGPGLFYDRVQ